MADNERCHRLLWYDTGVFRTLSLFLVAEGLQSFLIDLLRADIPHHPTAAGRWRGILLRDLIRSILVTNNTADRPLALTTFLGVREQILSARQQAPQKKSSDSVDQFHFTSIWPAAVELDGAIARRNLLYASADDYRRFKKIFQHERKRRGYSQNSAFQSAIYDLYDPAAPDPDPLLEHLKGLVSKDNGKDIKSSLSTRPIERQFSLRHYLDLQGILRDRSGTDDANRVRSVLTKSFDGVEWKSLAQSGRAPSRSTARIVKVSQGPPNGETFRMKFRDYTDQAPSGQEDNGPSRPQD